MFWLENQNIYIDQRPLSSPTIKHIAKQLVSVKTTAMLLLLDVILDARCY
jgi:hypothetical protein